MTESVVPQIPQAPQSPRSSQTEALARLVGFFETISLADVGRIGKLRGRIEARLGAGLGA